MISSIISEPKVACDYRFSFIHCNLLILSNIIVEAPSTERMRPKFGTVRYLSVRGLLSANSDKLKMIERSEKTARKL